ncbi:MAG: OmpA family protein [Pseudonocardia sp.]
MSRRAGLAGIAACCVLAFVPACAGPADGAVPGADPMTACSLPPEGAFALVTSRRALSAATLPPQARRLVVTFVRDLRPTTSGDPPGPPLILVNLDGAPAVQWRASFRSDGATDIARDYDRQGFLALFDAALRDMRAVEPEVDLLDGLAVAARAVRAAGGGAIVIADSGLATRGYVNFTDPGTLDATPEDVVTRLRADDALPDLSGVTVFLAVGDTAAPQAPLTVHYRKQVYAIWDAVVRAAGAACVASIDDSGPAVPPLADVPDVTEVLIPGPPEGVGGCRTVLADAGPVAFRPGTADFVDEHAADEQLAKVADELLAQRCGAVMLTGTTAHWTDRPLAYHVDLGTKRAERVRVELEIHHVPADRLRTRGVGYQFEQYVPDNDARGLLPGPAALNRTVRIDPCTPECPPA